MVMRRELTETEKELEYTNNIKIVKPFTISAIMIVCVLVIAFSVGV